MDILYCNLEKSGVTAKDKALKSILSAETKSEKAISRLLAGGKTKLSDLFNDESLDDELTEIKSISLASGYDDNYDAISNVLQDRMIVLDYAKAIYDWGVLADILNGEKYISYAKVKIFDKHKKDLALLKRVIREYASDKYRAIFNDAKIKNNYVAYCGVNKSRGKKTPLESSCTQEDLCKYIEEVLKKIEVDDIDLEYLKNEAVNRTLLPKQVTTENSVIPYQLNLSELKNILNNAEKQFTFLNNKDSDGFTVKDKIIKLFTFRIPYYVGPLNDLHKDMPNSNCWIVKRSNEKVLPWNFEKVVDTHASAEKFIKRMTNKCTYLIGEDVIPASSVLYSKYKTLNELNNLRINGEKISVELKQKIYTDIFLTHRKVKAKDVKHYIFKNGYTEEISKPEDIVLSGIDGDFKSSMASEIDFMEILGDRYNLKYVEEAINAVTIFGDDKRILKEKLKSIGDGFFAEEDIRKILNKKYKNWGNFSKKFLCEIPDRCGQSDDIRYSNIMEALWETNENLMQLLSVEHGFKNEIDKLNALIASDNTFSYDNLVKDLYVSPKIKRGIWQALLIVKEIVKVTGHEPKKFFIETEREHRQDGRKDSRKKQLEELYKNCKAEEKALAESLGEHTDAELRRDRLYLYYTQKGRCMYSGERIELEQLYNKNIYDIDHIFPQSRIKDDSLDNRVLVKRQLNEEKGDIYPIKEDIRKKMYGFWYELKESKLISSKKFQRLVRSEHFSENELAGFISRQLVETEQSTKAVAETLEKLYDKSRVVYVKANAVADFKRDNNLVKVRDVNDYHHAKDAFINIVVGNVHDEKFTKNPLNFLRNNQHEKYSMRRMFDFDIIRNEQPVWIAGENGTIADISKTYYKNDVLATRYTYEETGAFFDLKPVKKGKGQYPLKTSDSRFADIEKYGGYNKISGAYFTLVQHEKKGKKAATIESVPVYLTEKIKQDNSVLEQYVKETLKFENAKILIPKIKLHTLFCIEGIYMTIAGRTGDQIAFRNAMQLVLSKENYIYAKQISKYSEYLKINTTDNDPELYSDGEITAEKNKRFFDELKEKTVTVYSNIFGSFGSKLNTEKFKNLSLKEQCDILSKMLDMFKHSTRGSDLSAVDGAKVAGLIRFNKDISRIENISIINQSQTGMFRTITDLKKL